MLNIYSIIEKNKRKKLYLLTIKLCLAENDIKKILKKLIKLVKNLKSNYDLSITRFRTRIKK